MSKYNYRHNVYKTGTTTSIAIGDIECYTPTIIYYIRVRLKDKVYYIDNNMDLCDQANAEPSLLYNFDQIKSMIEKFEKDYSWKFVFIGADIDAIAEATKLNIETKHAHSVDRTDPNWVSECAFIMREEINNF